MSRRRAPRASAPIGPRTSSEGPENRIAAAIRTRADGEVIAMP